MGIDRLAGTGPLPGTDPAPRTDTPPRRTVLWSRRSSSARPRALAELAVVALLFLAYKAGRVVAAQHVAAAFDNAFIVWDLERVLRLPDEVSLQALTLRSTGLTRAANIYYAAVHFPATAGFLLWLYIRKPADYVWLRRSLATLTGAALLLHLALPLAPPRMLPQLGFVDTAALYGPAVYGPPGPGSLADQYAAMPSLHVGWALLVALGVVATTRSRWRWLALAHPVLTSLVVVVTANHFWLDGLVAGGLLWLALAAVRTASTPIPRPREAPDGDFRRTGARRPGRDRSPAGRDRSPAGDAARTGPAAQEPVPRI